MSSLSVASILTKLAISTVNTLAHRSRYLCACRVECIVDIQPNHVAVVFYQTSEPRVSIQTIACSRKLVCFQPVAVACVSDILNTRWGYALMLREMSGEEGGFRSEVSALNTEDLI